MPEALPDDLAEGLRTTAERRGRFGAPLLYFSETGSTNDIAAALAERGAPEGTTILSRAQTAGRGRLGRQWFSPPGAGLYVSVVCRDANVAPFLTLAGGVAVARGITAATALPVQIKWPNDIVVDGGTSRERRKLAGILAEGSGGSSGLHYVVLGIGINLRPAAYPSTIADRASSIETELGRPPDDGAVLGETLSALSEVYEDLRAGRSDVVLRSWRELSPSVNGSVVEWDAAGAVVSGTSAGIDDTGALLVKVGGRVERVISGELRWR